MVRRLVLRAKEAEHELLRGTRPVPGAGSGGELSEMRLDLTEPNADGSPRVRARTSLERTPSERLD